MSPPGCPKGEFPRGGTARSAQGALINPPGRPKGEFPLGGTACSAQGASVDIEPNCGAGFSLAKVRTAPREPR